MKETLEAKQAAIEAKFEEVKAQKEQTDGQSASLNEELVKLQGEYRVVTELLNAELPPATDPATTVVAEPEVTSGRRK